MTRDEFLDALLELPPAALPGGLPTPLMQALAEHPAWRADVQALATMDVALPAMGRPRVPAGFFSDQHQRILAAVAAPAPSPESTAWRAPSGGLVLLLGVVSAYVLAGMEGTLLGSLEAATELGLSGSDPLSVFGFCYLGMLALGLRSLQLDAHTAPAFARAPAGRTP